MQCACAVRASNAPIVTDHTPRDQWKRLGYTRSRRSLCFVSLRVCSGVQGCSELPPLSQKQKGVNHASVPYYEQFCRLTITRSQVFTHDSDRVARHVVEARDA